MAAAADHDEVCCCGGFDELVGGVALDDEPVYRRSGSGPRTAVIAALSWCSATSLRSLSPYQGRAVYPGVIEMGGLTAR